MSVLDKVTDPIKKWLLGVAIKKAIRRAARLGAAWVATQSLAKYGYTGGEAEILAAIYLALGWIKGYVKTKWPKAGAWL